MASAALVSLTAVSPRTTNASAPPDLRERVVVITGGNSGIGKEAAVALAGMGATVVITARNPQRGEAALDEVRQRAGSDRVDVMALDLADFASIRAFAIALGGRFERLDVLVNNAGGILTHRETTAQGFEMTFGVNHLGHFLLTSLLLDQLKESAPSRVINVASIGHRFAVGGLSFSDLQAERRYWSMDAYAKSKLANILFTRELARRLEGTAVTANCLHPGAVRTGFGSADDTSGFERFVMVLGAPFFIGPVRGARTTVHLASAPELVDQSGGYYVKCRVHRPSRAARDADAARRLWDVSEALIADSGA
jgi:NAD(P)-dependent dehydrogenase (short-subunit alcohol dehydrogenase family)